MRWAKAIKPFLVPVAVMGAFALNAFPSPGLALFVVGFAACWLLLALLTATQLRVAVPWLAELIPFLGVLRTEYSPPDELAGPTIHGKVLRLIDLVDPRVNSISNKVFVECTIVGPTVAFLAEGSFLTECFFEAADSHSLFFSPPSDTKTVYGVIPLYGCVIRRCVIRNVAFMTLEAEQIRRDMDETTDRVLGPKVPAKQGPPRPESQTPHPA